LFDLKHLNSNISEDTVIDHEQIKFKIIFKLMKTQKVDYHIVLQEDPSIIVYKLTDTIISAPKLEQDQSILERKILLNHRNEVYFIDNITGQMVLMKKKIINKKGDTLMNPSSFIKFNKKDLLKFLTLDIETLSSLDKLNTVNDSTLMEPMVISCFDIETKGLISQPLSNIHNLISNLELDEGEGENFKSDKTDLLIKFIIRLLQPKFHKYVVYAHNLSQFDMVFIYKTLLIMSQEYHLKLEPTVRDSKLISLKVRFDYREDYKKYRYYIVFHDSLNLLLSSLETLSNNFLDDNPRLQKLHNKEIIERLTLDYRRKDLNEDNIHQFYLEVKEYCEKDCVALAHIILRFAELIYNHYGINIHKHPTLSSLAFAIYMTKYNKNYNIPLISGKIYKDIRMISHLCILT
jgi:hypothetical protein